MKNETLTAIAVVLAVLVGIQTYMTFRTNERINQLTGYQNQQIGDESNIPNITKPVPPAPGLDFDLFKGRPWNPYAEMQHMQDEMEEMFGESFSRFHMKSPIGSLSKTPEVDLQEKSDHYIVTVNAPGADESSIDVKLKDQQLHISIKTEQAKDEDSYENGQYRYRERFVGEFHRILTLPGATKESDMKTVYKNGVLTITIPKK